MKRPNGLYRALYQLFARGFGWVYVLLLRVRVKGLRNIPRKGPFLVCANHRCVLDPVTLAVFFRQHLYFMAKRELFTDHGAFVEKVLRAAGAFPVERDSADLKSLREALAVLRRGDVLALFPQGRVVRGNAPVSPKGGAVWLAAHAGVPIVPVSIFCRGPWKFGRRLSVRIGRPLPPAPDRHSRGALEKAAAQLADALNRQLEESAF
mgnify:FL=1